MDRIKRAELALDGLSIGDAFGQRFFGDTNSVLSRIRKKEIPDGRWYLTDDSIMAIAIMDTLREKKEVDQDYLAQQFGQNYQKDPYAGYGGMAHHILNSIYLGKDWRTVSAAVFEGSGSYGNGAAMRIAPLGAYFADNIDLLKEQALLASEITHSHLEGKVGGLAIALASAWAFNHRNDKNIDARKMILFVRDLLPESITKSGVTKACDLSIECKIETAVFALGNGSRISAQDTVPFVLWCAARHMNNFEEALWNTVSGLGDRDTTCAMVGGIVSLYVGRTALPQHWLDKRESLTCWPERKKD